MIRGLGGLDEQRAGTEHWLLIWSSDGGAAADSGSRSGFTSARPAARRYTGRLRGFQVNR